MTPDAGLELAELCRLAMAEVNAGALLVRCRTDGRIAFVDGPAAAELVRLVRPGSAHDGRVTVAAPPTDTGAAGQVRSGSAGTGAGRVTVTALPTDAGGVLGTVHVLHDEAPADPDRCRAVLDAFARHIAVVLGRDGVPDVVERGRGGVLTVDDLPLLPDAVTAITDRVAEMMRPLTGATAVGIAVWDEERGILTALPGAFGATDELVTASVTGPVTNRCSVTSRVLATGQPYLSNRASGDPGVLQAYVELFEITRILSVPLNNGSRRIGVLHLVNKPSDFTAGDMAATEQVAPRIAIAVELAVAVARMSAQQRLEGVLTAVAVAIASGLGIEDGLLPAFAQLADVTAAALVALVPPDSAPLLCRRGAVDPEIEQRVLADARIFGPGRHGAFPQCAGDPGWAAVTVPVEVGGRRTATLAMLRGNGEPFTDAESDVLTRLASLVGLAWATEQYQRQLAEITRLQERERIADELHDRVAQILFAAQLGLDTMLERPDLAPDGRERLTEVRQLLVGGDVAIRDVINDLARVPGAHLGRRLRREVQAVEEEFAVVVHTDIPDDDALDPIPRTVADALVRVAREGTVNAAKHAGPCRIALTLAVDEHHVGLSVRDDGLGLPEARWSRGRGAGGVRHGVAALRRTVEDAGGALRTERSPGGFGTKLECRFAL